MRPYVRLTRIERRFDVWTLVYPSGIGCLLAKADIGTWIILMLGSILMLGIGCTYNDIVDRKIDAKTARTKNRPLPAGQIGLKSAWVFLGAQMAIAFLLFLFLSPFAKAVALGCLPLLFIYPYMKRVTYFPHIFAGLILNYGVLVSWAETYGALGLSPALVYLGCVFWSAGYDATYGLQDRGDDIKNNVKSVAVGYGKYMKQYLYGVYALMLAVMFVGGIREMNGSFVVLLPLSVSPLFYQVYGLNVGEMGKGYAGFHDNRKIGFGILLAFIIGTI